MRIFRHWLSTEFQFCTVEARHRDGSQRICGTPLSFVGRSTNRRNESNYKDYTESLSGAQKLAYLGGRPDHFQGRQGSQVTGTTHRRRVKLSKVNSKTSSPVDLDHLSINTICFLSVDAVQKGNSGHPGLPMGAAAFAYVLWTRFLKHNPSNPKWFDRDRFVLSTAHDLAICARGMRVRFTSNTVSGIRTVSTGGSELCLAV